MIDPGVGLDVAGNFNNKASSIAKQLRQLECTLGIAAIGLSDDQLFAESVAYETGLSNIIITEDDG